MAEDTLPIRAEDAFEKGLRALERRSLKESISLFQSAIDLERQEGVTKSPRMKYVSYLGLALTLSQTRSEQGLRLCEQAVKRDFFDPDLFCNLAIVYLRHRRKREAFEAFRKGLALKPGHRRITEELERCERRGDPVFTFLSRTNVVNRFAGLIRFKLRLLLERNTADQA